MAKAKQGVVQEAKPEMAKTARNQTVYKNEPILGGEKINVTTFLTLRAPVRLEMKLDDLMQALRSAEMRYNPNRTRLYDIIAQALLDGQLWGVLNKRTLSVLNQTVYYCDANGEELTGDDGDKMNAFIQSDDFRFARRLMQEENYWGISGIEAIPGKEFKIEEIPRKHIKPHNQIIAVEQNNQEYGYDYTKLDNVWIIGRPENLGILPQCAILVTYKRGCLADWSNFIEIFGMPIRKIKYDPLDSVAEAKLRDMVEEEGNLLAVMIPTTADFDILDGKTGNANGDLQNKFIKYLDDQISITVLGNTETTGNSGTGSQAKSKTHSDQQKEIIKADIEDHKSKLNHPQWIKILKSYGLPIKEGGRFAIKSEIDVNRAAQEVVIHTTLAAAGLKIPTNFLYDTYDIPEPGEGDEVLQAPKPPTPQEENELNMSDEPLTANLVKSLIQKELKSFFA